MGTKAELAKENKKDKPGDEGSAGLHKARGSPAADPKTIVHRAGAAGGRALLFTADPRNPK